VRLPDYGLFVKSYCLAKRLILPAASYGIYLPERFEHDSAGNFRSLPLYQATDKLGGSLPGQLAAASGRGLFFDIRDNLIYVAGQMFKKRLIIS
jgi:hypothetical protein